MSRAKYILEKHEDEINEFVNRLAMRLASPRKGSSVAGIGHTRIAKYTGLGSGVKKPMTKALVPKSQAGAGVRKPSRAGKFVANLRGMYKRGASKLSKMQQAQQQSRRDTKLPVPAAQAGAGKGSAEKLPNIAQKVAGRARDAAKAGAEKFSKYRQTDRKTNVYTGSVPSGAKTVGGQPRPQPQVMRPQIQPRTLKALGM